MVLIVFGLIGTLLAIFYWSYLHFIIYGVYIFVIDPIYLFIRVILDPNFDGMVI